MDFRQRGAALEYQMFFENINLKYSFQSPAYPEVFFDERGINSFSRPRFLEHKLADFRRFFCDPVHLSPADTILLISSYIQPST